MSIIDLDLLSSEKKLELTTLGPTSPLIKCLSKSEIDLFMDTEEFDDGDLSEDQFLRVSFVGNKFLCCCGWRAP